MKAKEESEKVGLKLNIQKTKIMASGPITLWWIDGKKWKQWQISSSGALKSLWMVTAVMKLEDDYFLQESYNKPRQCIKKQRHHLANKGPYKQAYGFSSNVRMCELDHKEG